ncbi:MAG TPA: SDR family oxidoreductase [Candidatus Bathyarchaeia archaeon]|nr:SDR family oxidoreductase [Candidatus Bathyarchaeia archaeon]
MEIKKVLVTGSDGYIGAVLSEKLVKKGYQVVGLDALFYKDLLLGPYRRNYHLRKGDICNLGNFDLSGFDAVIHLAALPDDPLERLNPELTEKINHLGTVKLAKACKKAGVGKFLFSSSCSVYGWSKEAVAEASPTNPLTTYAWSKKQSEDELLKLADDDFCIGILRNSTVYGYSSKFRGDLVVNNLTASALVLGELRVKSDGTPWRALIDVRDLSEIFVKFLEAKARKINGEVFNIGFNENNFQVKDIIKLVCRQLPRCGVVYTGEHSDDKRSYRVNFDKLDSLFPNLRQNWPLGKSIEDLVVKLKQFGYTREDFDSGKYNRVERLLKVV